MQSLFAVGWVILAAGLATLVIVSGKAEGMGSGLGGESRRGRMQIARSKLEAVCDLQGSTTLGEAKSAALRGRGEDVRC